MARQLSRNPHVDPWKKATTSIMNVPTFDRFKPGEDKGLSDPTWGGGKLGAVSTGAPVNLQRAVKPIARILPTMREHAEQGWEGMTGEYEDVPWSEGWGSLNEPVGRGLGAFQTLMSPISGAYTALFDEPVSETLQQYGGMDKETADMTAMGLGVALPLGWLGFSKWAKINPFATEILAEKLFGKTMPGTYWARGQVDPDQARRSVLKAGAVTAGAAAVGGPAAVRGVRGLITKAATPIVARSAILTGFGAGISKFITQVRRANADQVEIDLAARHRARDAGSSRVFGETLEDERGRITRNIDDEFEEALENNPQMLAMDEVFSQGPKGTATNLQALLRDAWISDHAGVPVGSQGHRDLRTGGTRKTKVPRDFTPEEIEARIQAHMEEGDTREQAMFWVEMAQMSRRAPDVDARDAHMADVHFRHKENPTPWDRPHEMRPGRIEATPQTVADNIGEQRFIQDKDLWTREGKVVDRAEAHVSNSYDHFEEWDQTLKAIEWYQKNDPEGLLRVLRNQKKLFEDNPTSSITWTKLKGHRPPNTERTDAVRVIDTLIVETEALIKPLKKAERGRAPGPGSLQARLDRAAAERARQAADKAKKKEDGFSWLDPMGWRKHPWFGGKE